MYHTYCKILGVLPGASQEEIRRAFRKKAKLSHPDLNPLPFANQEFIKVKKAFDYLSEPAHPDDSNCMGNYYYSAGRKKYYETPKSYNWESFRKQQENFRQSYYNSKKDFDFRSTVFGKIIFYFFHVLFFLLGLFILVIPTFSIVIDGLDPEQNIPATIFAVVCASIFGLIMTVTIIMSGFSVNLFVKR